ncbi:hypothetical protein [Nocardioides coralli]|uniref:hypothetical protein n=1 Tax=Nocardioides coralli TaxID=2872154 RepID=UPI001CA3DCF3|nr:hypothetical protein [Nocardioides coralli]QZY30347.1 hypothetical protein K6T13_06730 [Nocardioides coralli]
MSLPPTPSRPAKASPWPFAGMIGMACVAFLIGASILATPWYVVLVLSLVWVAGLVVAVRWFTPHPTWVPWLPVGMTVVWFAVVAGGAAVFDWNG